MYSTACCQLRSSSCREIEKRGIIIAERTWLFLGCAWLGLTVRSRAGCWRYSQERSIDWPRACAAAPAVTQTPTLTSLLARVIAVSCSACHVVVPRIGMDFDKVCARGLCCMDACLFISSASWDGMALLDVWFQPIFIYLCRFSSFTFCSSSWNE